MKSYNRAIEPKRPMLNGTQIMRMQGQQVEKVLAWPGLGEKSVNPYTWLIYESMRRDGVEIIEFSPHDLRVPECDVFHIHWPERIFWGRPSKTHPMVSKILCNRVISAALRVKSRGGILAWTAHNIEPHGGLDPQRRAVWDRYFERLRAQADLVISMSDQANALLLAAYPDLASRASVTIPHPHYRGIYPPAVAQAAARQLLEIPVDAFVLCSLGGMRRNKGIFEMIEAFLPCARDDEYLIVAGRCNDNEYLESLTALAGRNPRIRLINSFLSDHEISRFMSAADACLMNFISILNSGSVMLGLSFDKPVIAPVQGSIAELQRQVGRNWLLPLEQPIQPQSLRGIMDEARAREPQLVAPLAPFEPTAISRMTISAYEAVLRSSEMKSKIEVGSVA